MEKLIVCSCVKDDKYTQNSEFIIKNYLDKVKEGVAKFAELNNAKETMYLLPEGMEDPGVGTVVKYGIKTNTGDNPYSVQQQFLGNLPRPMIMDDYQAVYEDKEIAVIVPESAYWLANGADTKFITVTVGESVEVKEVKTGTKLSEVVNAEGAKAVLIGGFKGKVVLPENLADYAVSNDGLYDSVYVIRKEDCPVDFLVKHSEEAWNNSCGKCVVCREGTLQFKTIIAEMIQGKAKLSDIDLIKEVGELVKLSAYCPYGQNMPQPIIDILTLFKDEFDAHIRRKMCAADICFAVGDLYAILPDKCTGCEDCADECDEAAIIGKKGYIHMIDQDMCEHCGKCVDACEEGAIVKVDGKMPKLPKKLTKVGRF